MKGNNILLEVEHLKKYFPISKGIFRRTVGYVKAVDDIDFFIHDGETLGLVGESGCGKSTTGRCIIRLLEPTAGSVRFHRDDRVIDLLAADRATLKELRREIQIVFQDPFSSLDSRMTVRDTLCEPLKIHNIGDGQSQIKRASDLMELVGLKSYQMNRYPHQFSGGQRQRIGIARALALSPRLIICDEPVSALDVSVQAQVLNLLAELQQDLGLSYLFIAHDLSVVEYISNRVLVMYLGKIAEVADADSIYKKPGHPYTEALLQAIPVADPRSKKQRLTLSGTVPSASDTPIGCRFNTRCRYVQDNCRREEPPLEQLRDQPGHYVACHFAGELPLTGYEPRIDNKGAGQ